MQRTIVAKVRRGTPAQFTLMALNNRCSIGFHFEWLCYRMMAPSC